MDIKVFLEYLDVCTFKNKSMTEIKFLPWKSNENEVYIHHNSSYLSKDFLEKFYDKNSLDYNKIKTQEKEKTLADKNKLS